jgi:hypothetical protein
MALFRTQLHLNALRAALVLGVGLCCARGAQQEAPQLSQDTQDAINEKVRPDSEAKQWDKVLVDIDAILAKVPADSYDAAVMYKLKAQSYLNLAKANFPAALEALEHCLKLSDAHNYFTPKETEETVYYIAQLSYQEGAISKDPKRQMALFDETLVSLQRWLKGVDQSTLTQDNLQFLASLYFTLGQGIEINGEQKTNLPMMETALKWINRGLSSAAHPRDIFYQLKIAALFQLNRLEEGYEVLELRLKEKPDNRQYWQQLAATYIQLANTATEKHDDQTSYRYNVRAILTLERAQKLGFLNTPKDNYNLVGIYFSIGQFDRACELLDKGLRDGGIESTLQNWQLLAYSYQEQHQDMKAIHALEDAAKVFPKSGPIEYQIAQIYSGINKEKEALEHIKLCVANGGTEKPQVGWLFYAWLAYDLKDYNDALKAAQQAGKYPEAAKEAAKMEDAIKASILDRDNRAKALQTN